MNNVIKLLSLLSAAAAVGISNPSTAQSLDPEQIPTSIDVVSGNIDLTHLSFAYTADDLTAGDSQSGRLSLVRQYNSYGIQSHSASSFRQFFGPGTTHNLDSFILNCRASSDDETIDNTVVLDGKTYDLDSEGPNGDRFNEGNQVNCDTRDFVARDGTVAHALTNAEDPYSVSACGYRCISIDTIRYPNGYTLHFSYENIFQSATSGFMNRITNVVSSRGIGIRFVYMVSNSDKAHLDRRKSIITDAYVYRTQCPASVSGCIVGDISHVHYEYTQGPAVYDSSVAAYLLSDPASYASYALAAVTDASGAVTHYSYDTTAYYGPGLLTDVTLPGATSPAIHNRWSGANYWQDDALGHTIHVQMLGAADCLGGGGGTISGCFQVQYTDQLSHSSLYAISGFFRWAIAAVVDPLSRKRVYHYDLFERLIGEETAEGIVSSYTRDNRGNVTEAVVQAKPGSGLSNIVQTAGFIDCTSSNQTFCNQPSYVIDARGSRTDYGYDASGGIAYRISPPNSDNKRAIERYEYGNFHPAAGVPGLIGGGTEVIRLRTAEVQCLDSNIFGNTTPTATDISYACPAAATVRHNLAYILSSGGAPSSFELMSESDTFGAVTNNICYKRDVLGRVVAITKPRGATAGCN